MSKVNHRYLQFFIGANTDSQLRFRFALGISVISLDAFWQWLTRSPLGFLVVSLTIHQFSDQLLGVHPYSLNQFLIWFSELDKEYKAALVSAAVTVLGFWAAFATGLKISKQAAALAGRIEFVRELNDLTSAIDDCFSRVNTFARRVDSVYQVVEDDDVHKRDFSVGYAVNKVEEFRQASERFYSIEKQLFALKKKHSMLLVPDAIASTSFDLGMERLNQIALLLWIPATDLQCADQSAQQRYDLFVESYPREEYVNLKNVINEEHPVFVGVMAGLSHYLLSDVYTGNQLHNLVDIFRQREIYIKTIATLRRGK